MFSAIRRDLQAARDRDPAARSTLELVLCYPGIHAVWGYRISHWLWRRGARLPGRLCSALTAWLTGVDIHPGAILGPGLFIDHATGVVIGETAEIGTDVTMYHGVTLGGTSLARGKRHPTVGDRVTIGAGAKILGPITIGHDSRIGANAVVVKPVPPGSVVVGVPGQVIARSQPPARHGASGHRRRAVARPRRNQPPVPAHPRRQARGTGRRLRRGSRHQATRRRRVAW